MSTKIYIQSKGNYQAIAEPRWVFINTTENFATITTAGWLNTITKQPIFLSDIIVANYAGNAKDFFNPVIDSNGIITLVNNIAGTVPSTDVIVDYSPLNFTPDSSGGTSPINSAAAFFHGIDDALGKVGNYLNQPTDPADAATLVSNTPANVILPSLQPLPPGEWDVYGQVVFVPAGTTTATSFIAAISPTSATLPPLGGQINTARIDGTFSAAQTVILNVGPVRYSDATAIQFAYLVAQSTFAVNVMQAYGVLTAIRTLKA